MKGIALCFMLSVALMTCPVTADQADDSQYQEEIKKYQKEIEKYQEEMVPAITDVLEAFAADPAEDPDFGKVDPVALTESGMYYIVEQRPRFCTTRGGLKAGSDMAILSVDGTPVENLFGAGSVVGGANGQDSMTAMMNSWAIGSGRVSGEAAAKNAGFDSLERDTEELSLSA